MQSAAAVTGGILGLVLFGPVGALVLAAITNFVSKKDDEAGEALRGLGKTVVESYNFLTKLNGNFILLITIFNNYSLIHLGKYDLTGKVVSSVDSAIDGTENETIDTVKKTITNVSSKVSDLNSEYDLVGKASDAIKVAASLSDTAIEKVIELNEKYDFVETTKKVAGEAVNKIKESTNK